MPLTTITITSINQNPIPNVYAVADVCVHREDFELKGKYSIKNAADSAGNVLAWRCTGQ